ncbi:hypothetical protein FA15DRAFT_556180, partial [Coprinopsis marcescibilis]
FPHLPSSPDINPIEPLWNDIKHIIRALPHRPNTIPQLISAVKSAWESLDIEQIDKHTKTMSKRVSAIIEAEGSHTRY